MGQFSIRSGSWAEVVTTQLMKYFFYIAKKGKSCYSDSSMTLCGKEMIFMESFYETNELKSPKKKKSK